MNVYQCPKCSTEFSQGTKFCPSCGCNLELEFIENPICPKCHKEFSAGTKFCDIDGAKLTTHEKLIPKCVKCGKAYPAGTKYCPDDGGAIIPEAFRYGTSFKEHKASFGDSFVATQKPNSSYPKASLGNRLVAAILDSLIVTGLSSPFLIFSFKSVFSIISSVFGGSESSNNTVLYIVSVFLFIIALVYGFIKDGLGEGQSWGKKAVGLMVVYLPNNTPCSAGQSCLRYLIGLLLGVIAIIPVIGWLIASLIEPIMVLATVDGRRLADKAANTQVIEKKMFNK